MNVESDINLMERMGMLPPDKKLRRNIFKHYETIDEIIEERRQDDELPVPKFLYHLTPENKVNKILKNGLVPKAQNKLGKHPDRIYFFLQKDLTLNYKFYADDFWASGHKNTTRDVKYTLLKIDTKKCRNDFKIYGDPNMIRGVWTFNNVPPEAITIEEEGI